jgi:hypothetical protein
MALDIYSTSAMSDEPERVFSIAGYVLNPRHRCLTSDAMQWLLCLRSWQNSDIITLDQRLMRHAMIATDSLAVGDGDGDDDEVEAHETTIIDEVGDQLVQQLHGDANEDLD